MSQRCVNVIVQNEINISFRKILGIKIPIHSTKQNNYGSNNNCSFAIFLFLFLVLAIGILHQHNSS